MSSNSYLSVLRAESSLFRKVFKYPTNVNWYPGHMKKSLQQLTEVYLPSTHIVMEIRDARIPISCQHQCEQFLNVIKDKPRLVVFNKSDLLSKYERESLANWCENHSSPAAKYIIGFNSDEHQKSSYFSNKKATNSTNNRAFSGQIMNKLRDMKEEHFIDEHGNTSVFRNRLGLSSDSIIVSVMGYPNVGKSTIINGLRCLFYKKDSAVTGKLAGVTRHVSYFALQSTSMKKNNNSENGGSAMYLLDTPGIFVPGKTADKQDLQQLMRLAICGCIADHVIGFHEICDYILFSLNIKGNTEQYVKYCNLNQPSDDIDVVLNGLARNPPAFARRKGKQFVKQVFDPIENKEVVEYNEQITCNLFIDLFRSGKLDQTILDDLSMTSDCSNSAPPPVLKKVGSRHSIVLNTSALIQDGLIPLTEAHENFAHISSLTTMQNMYGTQLLCKVATCNLNQFALDFDGNLERVKMSVKLAKEQGARLRNGPELEICGYSCEDHFYECDTYLHCWQSICDILQSGITDGILCNFGAPIRHASAVYNCFIWILNSKIILIRPKLFLANDGNYREMRWFTSYTKMYEIQEYTLPPIVQSITGQRTVPFGAAIIKCNDTSIATELCEEMFTPSSPHIQYALNGVEIYCNGSGSHHNLRKLHTRIRLIQGASARCGGAYLYANHKGCDGNRLYFDGCAMIVNNGEMLVQAQQFSLDDVEVISAVIDLTQIRDYRHIPSFGVQADAAKAFPVINVDFWMSDNNTTMKPAIPTIIRYHQVEEEIAMGPSFWLWDYLRRCGASGFFLPLSGGSDSAATATIVGIMCVHVMRALDNGNEQVLKDLRRICNCSPVPSQDEDMKNENEDMSNDNVDQDEHLPKNAKELCNILLHTTYMGTTNSSKETRSRAKCLANEIGSYHIDCDIDCIVNCMIELFKLITGKIPTFRSDGGTWTTNLALQNLQARLRMVLSYFLGQLLPWVRGRTGFLLVLGSGNVDEALRGYYTKYDCSSADLNPIGGITKCDLRNFLLYAAKEYGFKSLVDIVSAKPTAELEPITDDYVQSDESDMGFTYEELGVFAKLRNGARCGPVSMYQALEQLWGHNTYSSSSVNNNLNKHLPITATDRHHSTPPNISLDGRGNEAGTITSKCSGVLLSPAEIAKKVKYFFTMYGINRHKQTTLTPSYHAEKYSPDDNRFDHRQFLYPNWKRQFSTIDTLVVQDEEILDRRMNEQREERQQRTSQSTASLTGTK